MILCSCMCFVCGGWYGLWWSVTCAYDCGCGVYCCCGSCGSCDVCSCGDCCCGDVCSDCASSMICCCSGCCGCGWFVVVVLVVVVRCWCSIDVVMWLNVVMYLLKCCWCSTSFVCSIFRFSVAVIMVCSRCDVKSYCVDVVSWCGGVDECGVVECGGCECECGLPWSGGLEPNPHSWSPRSQPPGTGSPEDMVVELEHWNTEEVAGH